MSITLAALLVAIVGSAAAFSSSSSSSASSSSKSCSAPPSSIEVCLSSVFSSIESSLSSIAYSLSKHEHTVYSDFSYEFYYLTTELTQMSRVYSIADSVRSVVDYDYSAINEQIEYLQEEKYHLEEMVSQMIYKLERLNVYKQDVVEEIKIVYSKYESVRVAHWSLNAQISEIAKAKNVIIKEEADVDAVINKLNDEISIIEEKISQLNKRQEWLVSWEQKLYIDLSSFVSEVKKFKNIEIDLHNREGYLYIEQSELLSEVDSVQSNIAELYSHYDRIDEYLKYLKQEFTEILRIREDVSEDSSNFDIAFSQFSCEVGLLEAEACSSSAPAPVKPKPLISKNSAARLLKAVSAPPAPVV